MLPRFIVGESGGLRLNELSNLKDLRGELHIEDLQNVSDIQDASKANLFKIEGLEELRLAWTHDFQTSLDESFELQVLSPLKPHSNLKRLQIDSYGGSKFPSWIGDPSFSKLEYLGLYYCERSTLLPRLVQLPQLIQLSIRGCPQLTCSKMSLPSLQSLYLEACEKVVLRSVFDSTSLTELSISRISELTCLPRSITQNMTALETLEINRCGELTFLVEDGDSLSSFSSLTRMSISKCPLLQSLTDLLPRTLEVLNIKDCANLECLPNGLHSLTCLKDLFIERCKKFVGFLVTDFPLYLHHLVLIGSEALESLPIELMMTTEAVSIRECPRLKFFLTGELLARLEKSTVENSEKSELLWKGDESNTVTVNLERTSIFGMGKLNFPIDCMHNLSRLYNLEINGCKSLESLPERLLSTSTLKTLDISGCDNLKSLPNGMYNCTSLQELSITNWKSIESMPERLLSTSTLKTLVISGCDNLKSMPNGMYNFTSLQGLAIRNCPGIASIAEGGLPLNLKRLAINCEGLKQSMSEWRLDKLTSLEEFEIGWICPPDDLLPTSLKTLIITRVLNLESITKGLLQNLASLRELRFDDCLILKTLPKEGLPPSLKVLEIRGCPLLEQRCLKEEGDYWPLISHIPWKYIGENRNYPRIRVFR